MIAAPPHRLGRFQLHCVSDGQWRMDGGSVFGLVPKVMWEKIKTPDSRNRIPMATNCMLVRTPGNGVDQQWRTELDQESFNVGANTYPGRLPVWLRVVRSSNCS